MIDLKAAEKIFSDFEFRTMNARLREALTNNSSLITNNSSLITNNSSLITNNSEGKSTSYGAGQSQITNNKEGKKQAGLNFAEQNSSPSSFPITDSRFAISSIMLWLLNSTMTNPTWDDICSYTGKDTAEEAAKYLSGEIKKQELAKVYEEIEKPLIPVIEKMNAKGVAVNTKYLVELGKEYRISLKNLEEKIWEMADEKFNIASPKQLGQILFVKLGLKAKNQKKTGGGALSTRESELQKLADIHPIIPLILQYRELAKLLSTYIDNLVPMVGEDGRLHAKFLSAGTTTC